VCSQQWNLPTLILQVARKAKTRSCENISIHSDVILRSTLWKTSGVTAKPANGGHFKTGQRKVARDYVVLLRRLLRRQVCFRAPTPWTTFKYVAMMK
jgi:hypothetical protein